MPYGRTSPQGYSTKILFHGSSLSGSIHPIANWNTIFLIPLLRLVGTQGGNYAFIHSLDFESNGKEILYDSFTSIYWFYIFKLRKKKNLIKKFYVIKINLIFWNVLEIIWMSRHRRKDYYVHGKTMSLRCSPSWHFSISYEGSFQRQSNTFLWWCMVQVILIECETRKKKNNKND